MGKYSVKTIILVFVFSMIGCGDGSLEGKAKMEVPELGLSMYAPSGWRVESRNPRMCAKGNNSGVIMDEPLEGKVFRDYVDQLSEAHGGRVISSTSLAISGYDALQAVIEYANAGSKSIKVYIHKVDRFIEVSFVTSTEDFPKHEPALRHSIASIKIK